MHISKYIARSVQFLIYGLRPLLGPSNGCLYEVGCTRYTIECFEHYSLGKATMLAIKRLLSCNPLVGFWNKTRNTGKPWLSIIVFAIGLVHTTGNASTLMTESIDINACNPELIRSSEVLIQLLHRIKTICFNHAEFIDQVSVQATDEGLSVMCSIEKPRGHIVIAAINSSNTIHCTIVTASLKKSQVRLAKEALAKIVCFHQ